MSSKDTTEDNVWDFPDSIKSGTAEEGHVNYAFSITGGAAETASVTYSVDSEDGSTKNGTFDIWLDVGDSLDENPTLRAQLHGFGAGRISDGQTVGLGFKSEDEQRTLFILAGGQPGTELTTTYPNSAWMQDNLDALGCRQLREICMPGSHDAGMSEFNSPTFGVTDYETLTQTLDISGELHAGARYFDIRPVINGGHYGTGHFTGVFGADGQSMQDIIWDINNFTDTNAELIILAFASSVNRDNNFKTFNRDTRIAG